MWSKTFGLNKWGKKESDISYVSFPGFVFSFFFFNADNIDFPTSISEKPFSPHNFQSANTGLLTEIATNGRSGLNCDVRY